MESAHDLSDLRRSDLPRPDASGSPSEGPARLAVPPPPIRWRTRILLPGAILLALAAILAWSLRDALRPAALVEVVPVVVKEVAGAPSSGGVAAQAPGWVEPAPYPISVAALASGIVSEVLFLEGQTVRAGDVMVRLVDADARLALSRAEAEASQRRAELDLARVAAGDGASEATALEETRLDLERVPAEIARLEARVEELREELAAKSRAADSGVVSPVQVNIVSARLRSQEAELRSARSQEGILRARLRRLEAEARASVAKAEAALLAAISARDEARLRLDRMEIQAPADGTVLSRLVEPGSAVAGEGRAGGAPVARLYDPARLQVRVDVPLAAASRVAVGQPAEVVVDVLPDAVFEGKVTRAVHEADIQRNTVQFKVEILDPSPHLKPEMLARVKVLSPAIGAGGPAAPARVFGPASVLGTEPDRSVPVWVADPSRGVALVREAVVGRARSGEWVEVVSGLNPGDRLIVSPPAGLKEGDRIRIVEGRTTKGGAHHGSH